MTIDSKQPTDPRDPKDRILDSFLDEMLSDHQPPDVSRQVLDRLRPKKQERMEESAETQSILESLTEQQFGRSRLSPRIPTQRRRISRIPVIGISAAALVLIGLVIGVVLQRGSGNEGSGNDGFVDAKSPSDESGTDQGNGTVQGNGDDQGSGTDQSNPDRDNSNRKPPEDPVLVDSKPNPKPDPNRPPEKVEQNIVKDTMPPRKAPPKFVRQTVPPTVFRKPSEVAGMIDSSIREVWTSYDIQPEAAVTEQEWGRRVFAKLFGGDVTDQELQVFMNAVKKEGRESAVSALIDRRHDEFAAHWSKALAFEVLGASKVPANDRDFKNLVIYLEEALLKRKPWDNIAYQLVSATGGTAPNQPGYNPATGFVGFVLKERQPKSVYFNNRLAANVTRKPLQCARCHSYEPVDGERIGGKLEQRDFWGFNAYLRQTRMLGAADKRRLRNGNFVSIQGNGGEDAPVFFADPSERVIAFYPRYDGKDEDIRSGLVRDVVRRNRLAKRVAESAEWRKVVVDNVWSVVFGMPFDGPYGSKILAGRGPLGGLNDQLADQLAAHDYQIEPLVVAMLLSEPFRLGDRGEFTEDNPGFGSLAFFSHRYPKTRSGPLAHTALKMVAKSIENSSMKPGVQARRIDFKPEIKPRNKNGKPAAPPVNLPATASDWAVPQYIGRELDRIAAADMSDSEKIRHLFVLAIGRLPMKWELKTATEILVLSRNPNLGLYDVWWALINSREF